jgi:hyperosmotically inducible protein
MRRQYSKFPAAAAFAAAATFAGAHALRAQSVQDEATTVRQDLRAVPGYGVFDLITFQVNPDRSVTLAGYVTAKETKRDAERAITTDAHIGATVQNKIELAPVGATDDRLRHEVYTAIYRDKFLSKYGTPEDQAASEHGRLAPWGDAFGEYGEFGNARWTGAPFYGQEPIGNYAIHILVKHGTITLAGVVESQDDKDAAARDALRVRDVHDVNNDLHVKGK